MEKEFMEKVLAKLDKQEEFSQKMLHKLEKHDKDLEQISAKLEEHDKKFDKVFAKLEEHDKKFDKVFAKLEEHDKKFDKVFAKLEEHDKKFEEHSKEIRSINNFLIVKEDELFNKIRALFDGYTANLEKNNALESRQTATEQKVDINSLRISMLEDTSKHHTEQISKLLAK